MIGKETEEKSKKHRIREERATQKVDKSFAFPLSPPCHRLAAEEEQREKNTDSHTYVEKAQFYN